MAKLEEILRGAKVLGILPGVAVEILDVKWLGTSAVSVVYRDTRGDRPDDAILYRSHESSLEVQPKEETRRAFDADPGLFRLTSEAHRIRLAHLFDPMLAIHTSLVEPLPHQITAVYAEMLPRQPLRFLLADDAGAGKTIMAGLFIKELIARGDLKRCLICCPGSLVEQWQEEMATKFQLPFVIVTNELIQADLSGNPFASYDLVIARLDHMSRNEEIQSKLRRTEWDLVVADEAHKMSSPWYGNEPKPTRRYNLGKLLGATTRHLLLMTATPHNGKDQDFHSFMQLLDQDRFEGRLASGSRVEAGDLMRRMVKEDLVKFDGTPLFPERRAYAPQYNLTAPERGLYEAVTEYVSHEMNRVERLQVEGQRRRGAIVGFAMTTLQRRLASSPEAIYQSLRRRHERLTEKLQEIKEGEVAGPSTNERHLERWWDFEEGDDDDLSDDEREDLETEVLEHVTAAVTVQELRAEIETVSGLEKRARQVRSDKNHGKWNELASILTNQQELFDAEGHRRKLIIFTEHLDTLRYLATRIRSLLGKRDAVVTIHGSLSRQKRRYSQESFVQDKDVVILVATDAAGEGVNLQRAHLMINYDLPWNPNRLEQRFGRIHRIGQTEVCHMWNLVAKDTREGQVFARLFEKIERERKALGGRVFDVLGRAIEARDLRDLLIEAIRYGDRKEVREKLFKRVEAKLDRAYLEELLEEQALAHDAMDASRVRKIKEDMERAEARRLQPHFIEAFFLKAFRVLGGTVRPREPRRYEISYVPAIIRSRSTELAPGRRVQRKYERITFEKDLIQIPGRPTAEFVCPGHPLLDAVLDLILEQNRDVLDRGAVLIDIENQTPGPRALWYIQSEIRDARTNAQGRQVVVSRLLHFIEVTESGEFRKAGQAPYLDYRPPDASEQEAIRTVLNSGLLDSFTEEGAIEFASSSLLEPHFNRIKEQRAALVEKTKHAVQDRLTKEITHWDRRANELKAQELAGKKTRLSSGNARRRADELEVRLQSRMEELDRELQLRLRPPVVAGAAIVIPSSLIDEALGRKTQSPQAPSHERDEIERLAMLAVTEAETALGREPRDVSADKVGYDIESKDPDDGKLYFIEVKGRVVGAEVVTVSKNEILTGLNKPESFVLAIALVDESSSVTLHYLRDPFQKEPDFDATSVNYKLKNLLSRAKSPS